MACGAVSNKESDLERVKQHVRKMLLLLRERATRDDRREPTKNNQRGDRPKLKLLRPERNDGNGSA
jgi:hypothetical protein